MVKNVLIGKSSTCVARNRIRKIRFVELAFILREGRGVMVNRRFHKRANLSSRLCVMLNRCR
jgi:hypothetical protein